MDIHYEIESPVGTQLSSDISRTYILPTRLKGLIEEQEVMTVHRIMLMSQ